MVARTTLDRWPQHVTLSRKWPSSSAPPPDLGEVNIHHGVLCVQLGEGPQAAGSSRGQLRIDDHQVAVLAGAALLDDVVAVALGQR